MIRRLLLLIIMLTVSGCIAEEITCEPPTILVGSECCNDTNTNKICDSFEEFDEVVEEPGIVLNATETNLNVSNITEEESVETMVLRINHTQLERQITKKFPIYNYSFKEKERENVTGIENTYRARRSTLYHFDIYLINKTYNYLNNVENYTNFVQRHYDLDNKNSEINANKLLDAKQRTDVKWNDAYFTTNNTLERIDNHTYFERQSKIFIRPVDHVVRAWLDISVIVWCTPEIVVRVYPTEEIRWGYIGDMKTASMEANMGYDVRDRKGPTLESAEKIKKICEVENFNNP